MPPSILSFFVYLSFLRDDVMQENVWFFIRGCFYRKIFEISKVISKHKNHFNASLKQACSKKTKSNNSYG
jgi:hypothetical protein